MSFLFSFLPNCARFSRSTFFVVVLGVSLRSCDGLDAIEHVSLLPGTLRSSMWLHTGKPPCDRNESNLNIEIPGDVVFRSTSYMTTFFHDELVLSPLFP